MKDYSTMSDSELIDIFKAGDNDAFDCLVERYQQKIFSLAYCYLQNVYDADDAAQIVFLKVFKYLNSFRGDAKFSTWLYKIAVNTFKNILKSKINHNPPGMISIDQPLKRNDDTFNFELPDERLSPKRALRRKEKSEFIDRIINSLKPEKKKLLELRHKHGYSYDELADIFDVDIGTIKSRLSRIKKHLWKEFGKERNEMR